MKLYVASSWRNPYQPNLVEILRGVGHEVYDFRHPPAGDHLGFSWSDVDPDWQRWTPKSYLRALAHPIARAGFASDFGAMHWADACVLVLPCGRSAHLEAGWFVGAGKPLIILLDAFIDPEDTPARGHEAELMYAMATRVVLDIEEALAALGELQTTEAPR